MHLSPTGPRALRGQAGAYTGFSDGRDKTSRFGPHADGSPVERAPSAILSIPDALSPRMGSQAWNEPNQAPSSARSFFIGVANAKGPLGEARRSLIVCARGKTDPALRGKHALVWS